jgi:hypothetical protein
MTQEPVFELGRWGFQRNGDLVITTEEVIATGGNGKERFRAPIGEVTWELDESFGRPRLKLRRSWHQFTHLYGLEGDLEQLRVILEAATLEATSASRQGPEPDVVMIHRQRVEIHGRLYWGQPNYRAVLPGRGADTSPKRRCHLPESDYQLPGVMNGWHVSREHAIACAAGKLGS